MTSRESSRTAPSSNGNDPAQLSLGDAVAATVSRAEQRQTLSESTSDQQGVAFREPPVCGESSYDDVEEMGLSWSVRTPLKVEEWESPPRPPAAAAPLTPAASPTPMAPSTKPAPARAAAKLATARPTSKPVTERSTASPDPLAPLRRAMEGAPDNADAAILYANALEKTGNWNGALDALEACLSRGGDELRLRCARAFLLGARLRYDEADAELRKAAKLHGDDAAIALQSGILACRRARWRDAVEPLQKAAHARADDALAHFYLGEALNHVDQLQGALAAYEQAASLDAGNWRAFKGVGIVLDRLGRPDEAAAAYRRMREAQGRA